MRRGTWVGVGALWLASVAAAGAQTVPAGWTVVKDVRKVCQIAVPASWIGALSTRSPSGQDTTTVTVHGLRAGETFEAGKIVAKQVSKPIVILQDDSRRLMYTTSPPPLKGAAKNGWYVVTNSSPVCAASFAFNPGADESLLKQIADTLGPAR